MRPDAPATPALKNLEKVYWPEAGFTKGDMIAYYRAVAPVLLPHIAGRPMTLARFPEGVAGPGWYQTNCVAAPPWLRTVSIPPARGAGRPLRYAVIEDLAGLLWAANWGAIELHPFLATADDRARPLVMVFDLDPGPPAGAAACAALALRVRDRLERDGFVACAKTSGAAGLHVYVPPRAGATFADTKAYSRAMAEALHAESPALVAPTMALAERAGRVYVDWRQNDPNLSTIAPYSLRARRLPIVSTPLTWAEVEAAAKDPSRRTQQGWAFSPADVIARIAVHGDLMAPVLVGRGV
jgi:bifunctional non-homologous end joining protein LigD